MALYTRPIDTEADVLTVKEFKGCVKLEALTDYDGFGHPSKFGLVDETIEIKPSRLTEIPKCATHIIWYNR